MNQECIAESTKLGEKGETGNNVSYDRRQKYSASSSSQKKSYNPIDF